MLRHPAERLLSAYYWIRKNPQCCSGDWGWHQTVFVPVRKAIQGGAPAKEAIDRFKGCETNMITGQAGCMAGVEVPRERVEEAKRRVWKFLFVGLVEQWQLSVCLYNYITTGETIIHSYQLSNNRPTNGRSLTRYTHAEVAEDNADEEVYLEARKRFKQDLANYGIRRKDCRIIS
jgi:hypothetical protein